MEARYTAPQHLSERARAIWEQLVPSRCRSIGRRTLLQTALEALDLADMARSELAAANSLTTKTLGSGTIHQHPGFKTLKEARAQFHQLWATLRLESGSEDAMDFDRWLQKNAPMEVAS